MYIINYLFTLLLSSIFSRDFLTLMISKTALVCLVKNERLRTVTVFSSSDKKTFAVLVKSFKFCFISRSSARQRLQHLKHEVLMSCAGRSSQPEASIVANVAIRSFEKFGVRCIRFQLLESICRVCFIDCIQNELKSW